MTTLREAAQQALEALELYLEETNSNVQRKAITSLRAALAQEEQEPVAWASWRELARIKDFDSTIYANGDFDGAVPLYLYPPRREWQSLSEDENNELSLTMVKGYKSVNWLSRAIERALKEKNA